MKSHRRHAFTLVELLVVITIIGMLVALLLPAVNSARESARQTTCMNNQQNFGKALQTYIMAKDRFPGYRQTMPLQDGTGRSAVISWQVALLPYVEKTDIYQALQAGSIGISARQMPFLELSICPSDNSISGRSAPWTSYVCNSGMLDNAVVSSGTTTIYVVSPPNPSNTPESPANGIFQDRVLTNSTFRTNDIKSGQATTLMLTENVDAYYYQDPIIYADTPAKLTAANVNNTSNAPNCMERATSFVWWDTSPKSTTTLPTPPSAPNPGTTPSGYPQAVINVAKGDWDPSIKGWPTYGSGTDGNNYAARPSSYHPGGVVMTFAAANSRYIREDIDYSVYCLLMASDHAHATTNSHSTPAPFQSWMKFAPVDEGAL